MPSLFTLDAESSQSKRRPPSRSGSALFEDKPGSGSGSERLAGGDSQESNPPDELPPSREPSQVPIKDSEKLEHPVFPWQKPGGSSSLSRPLRKRESTLAESTEVQHQIAPRVHPTGDPSPNQNAISSFQEQLLQQQRLLQEQLAAFQAQSSSTIATVKTSCAAELEKMRGEVESAMGRVKELEEIVERKNMEISDKQVHSSV